MVIERLRKTTVDSVEQDIKRDFGAFADEEWVSSSSHRSRLKSSFNKDSSEYSDTPVALPIRSIDLNGVVDCGVPHYLKPHVLFPCRLKNILDGMFPDDDSTSPSLELVMCANPSTIGDSKSSTFILSRELKYNSEHQYLQPFQFVAEGHDRVFFVTLCSSYPGAQLGQQRSLDRSPDYAFWTVRMIPRCRQCKHGLKAGKILRFFGDGLPSHIMDGRRYMVSEASKFSFIVCGPLMLPVAPLEFPFSVFHHPRIPVDSSGIGEAHNPCVVRRSPIGRCN
jgi:hypothetical protein